MTDLPSTNIPNFSVKGMLTPRPNCHAKENLLTLGTEANEEPLTVISPRSGEYLTALTSRFRLQRRRRPLRQ